MNGRMLLILLAFALLCGCAHYHHPRKQLVINRCKTQLEVLGFSAPDQRTPKILKECDAVFSDEKCRTAWRTHAAQCNAEGIPAVLQACAPQYCPHLKEKAPRACGSDSIPTTPSERYELWHELQLEILCYELGDNEGALIQSVIGPRLKCMSAPVTAPVTVPK